MHSIFYSTFLSYAATLSLMAGTVLITSVPDSEHRLESLTSLDGISLAEDTQVFVGAFPGLSDDQVLDLASQGGLAQISSAFVPYFVKNLKYPKTALWETDGVLYSFSKAKPEDIRVNLNLIKPWLTHEDWYLRESAFYAMLGLRATIKPEELFMMAEVFAAEKHSKPQINYAGAFGYLFKKLKVSLSDKDTQTFARP